MFIRHFLTRFISPVASLCRFMPIHTDLCLLMPLYTGVCGAQRPLQGLGEDILGKKR